MNICHAVNFDFDLALAQAEAVMFVQDVKTSLSKADFIRDIDLVQVDSRQHVRAAIPVNAALFGQGDLRFESLLMPTSRGAKLLGLPLNDKKPGWAEVSGEALVRPLPSSSQVSYRFDVAIELALPEPEKWGGQALLKMVEFTAQRVVEAITADFPAAVQTAAREFEAACSKV